MYELQIAINDGNQSTKVVSGIPKLCNKSQYIRDWKNEGKDILPFYQDIHAYISTTSTFLSSSIFVFSYN